MSPGQCSNCFSCSILNFQSHLSQSCQHLSLFTVFAWKRLYGKPFYLSRLSYIIAPLLPSQCVTVLGLQQPSFLLVLVPHSDRFQTRWLHPGAAGLHRLSSPTESFSACCQCLGKQATPSEAVGIVSTFCFHVSHVSRHMGLTWFNFDCCLYCGAWRFPPRPLSRE